MGKTVFYPALAVLLPLNVVGRLARAEVVSPACADLAAALAEAGGAVVRCAAVALAAGAPDGCECSLRGRQCPFDCSAQRGAGCVDAPAELKFERLSRGKPFEAAAIGGVVTACMYWAAREPRTATNVQDLVDAAAEAAESNAAAVAARLAPPPASLLAAVAAQAAPLPPEDQFRTRCLTFSHGVVVQSAGSKDAAYRLLGEHCLERKAGLEVEPVPAAAEERCRRYAEAWLREEDWTSAAAREAWCQQLYRGAAPALLARERRVFFREVYFGAAHGVESLEAALRCAPHVEATQAGTFFGLDAVRVVYEDPPGLAHFDELVQMYKAYETAGSGFGCVKPECRPAIICTTASQLEREPSCECVSIIASNGAFSPLPASAQATADPTCGSPARNHGLHGSTAADLVPPTSSC